MIKRIIFIENPAFLSVKNKHLIVKIKNDHLQEESVPVEDIEILLINNQQITITVPIIQEIQKNNIPIIICDETHMPFSIILPIEGNCLQHERIELQANFNKKLKDNLWKKIIHKKITNQASMLEMIKQNNKPLLIFSKQIKAGDSSNREALSSAYYWKQIFQKHISKFTRDKNGKYPNNLLNFGYSIIRSTISNNIVSHGLLPSMGIFHKNKFNAFCLADDLMEPFRVFVDSEVYELISQNKENDDFSLNKRNKENLVKLLTKEVIHDNKITSLNQSIKNSVNDFLLVLKKEKNFIEYPTFKI